MTTEIANAALALPIRAVVEEIREGLAVGHVVLVAPPGSGKTTGVPPALLDCDWLAGRRIVMLEPRRPAARMAANRIATLLGEPVGKRVGYQIRFERKISAATRIEIVTEGILTRRLQQDPELSDVGLVIFDEFHERNLQGDLALAFCLDVAAALREDLRLLVMSATLADERVDRLLSARRISAQGRSYPVEIRYPPAPRRAQPAATVRRPSVLPLIVRALREQRGDVLVFLSGRREIEQVRRGLEELDTGTEVLALYGDLSSAEQDRVLQPAGREQRRVILATDIAETSLTIPGVEAVVDSGLARKPSFDPNSGLTRLRTVRIAQDSAAQRAGRAGRTAPGVCYRAWPESEQQRLSSETPAEILQADLAPLALELASWGVVEPNTLAWLDPPPVAHWSQAVELLRRLGAIDDYGRLSETGKRMADLPVHPRLARLLVEAQRRDQYPLACDLAAILSERDPRLPGEEDRFGVDLSARIEALQERRNGGSPQGFDLRRLRTIERITRQLLDSRPVFAPDRTGEEISVGGLISLSYPDRIAKRANSLGRFTLTSGRQVRLPEHDPLAGADWLVVPQLDGGQRDARAWLAAALTRQELQSLHGHRIRRSSAPDWHPQTGAVRQRCEQRLDRLVLDVRYSAEVDPAATTSLLLREVERRGLELLHWTPAAKQLRARSEQYRQLLEPSEWPELSDSWLQRHLNGWLAGWLAGVQSIEQLKSVDLREVFRALLGWQRMQRLDEAMPLTYTTPAGTERQILYSQNEPPVLAVRLQELFGLAQTPRIAAGQLGLVLHLLSPASRVVQITQDLEHFWRNGYRDVRKEMRGRYPKHDWPENPLTAVATSRTHTRHRK